MPSAEYEEPEQKKILDKPSIATLGTEESDLIHLENLEVVTVTAEVAYEAGADVSVLVRLKFCPDGGIFDTIPYTSFYLTYSAGATVKRSVPVDVPPQGMMKVELYNGDNIDTGRARVWWTGQRRKVNPEPPTS